MSSTWALDPRCELGVLAEPARAGEEHEDLGCGLQGPHSRLYRRALDPLRRRIRQLGEAAALARAAELVEWAERQPAYDALCTPQVIDGRRVLRSDVLFGSGETLEPRFLHVRWGASGHDYKGFDYPVAPGAWESLHDLTALLLQGASEKEVRRVAEQGGHSALLDDLLDAGWLGEREVPPAPSEARAPGLWFLGHNSVLVSSKTARVLVDPWFRPWREADPDDYRPLRPCDVGPVDAIAITHSHGDHFHLGSLLAFPRDTLLLVPRVERESIAATDLARRLKQVGFTRIKTLAWWEETTVGDVAVQAMPFFGEQASSIALVDPTLRNHGNTWIVRTPDVSAAFLADTGRDPAGSMQDAALIARRRWGSVDVVFGGMRGFSISPLFLPFTTLDAQFCNVPVELLAVRQRLMHDATELLAATEIFGARYAVPYADGGAPWYWREGMGPAYAGYPGYPGERDAPQQDEEDPRSAPFPERLQEAAEERYPGAPLVESLLLRPADVVRWGRRGPRVGRVEGFAWPWDDE